MVTPLRARVDLPESEPGQPHPGEEGVDEVAPVEAGDVRQAYPVAVRSAAEDEFGVIELVAQAGEPEHIGESNEAGPDRKQADHRDERGRGGPPQPEAVGAQSEEDPGREPEPEVAP